VQHVVPEGPYAIGLGLARAGVELDVRRVFVGEPLPPGVDAFDGLVIMGGPMSAASDSGFPTRRQEMALAAEALEVGLPVLGICLGAQILAAAAGAPVYPGGAGPEIGWGDIRLATASASDPLLAGVGPTLRVLHWHGDTFDLPDDAVLLGSTDRYANQAFRLGPTAWGLQFHLEVDEAAVRAFLTHFGADALSQGVDPGGIAAATPSALRALGATRDLVARRFAAGVRERSVNRLTTEVV
jgi:GMP synthase-like glutamine amidotransferase